MAEAAGGGKASDLYLGVIDLFAVIQPGALSAAGGILFRDRAQ
jgi:hypothetical protein